MRYEKMDNLIKVGQLKAEPPSASRKCCHIYEVGPAGVRNANEKRRDGSVKVAGT